MPERPEFKILADLTTRLAKITDSSPASDWGGVSETANQLAGSLLAAGESDGQEMAEHLAALSSRFATGTIANLGAGARIVRNILGVLQGLKTPAGMPESLRRQASAEADLFLKDIQKEEKFTKSATSIDDEEQREMMIALEQRIDELENDLMELTPPESDPERVRAIFRQYHTLKGEGAICGIKSVAEFCHGIESEIEEARQGNLILTAEVVSTLQALTDIIRPILNGKSREEIGAEMIDGLIADLHQAVANSKLEVIDRPADQNNSPAEDQFADFFSGMAPPPLPPGETENQLAESAPDETASPGESTPPPSAPEAALLEPQADDGSAALVETTPPGEVVAPVAAPNVSPMDDDSDIDDLQVLNVVHTNVSGKTMEEVLSIAPHKPLPDKAEKNNAPAEKAQVEKPVDAAEFKAISVDVHVLDNLMELVSEVSLTGSFFSSQLADHSALSVQANNLSRACSQLQEAANSIRMTSIRPLFMTVRRAAVEAARSSRKLIDIKMNGTDTQVDRSIVENLSAALIHVIRNAVDHGIEDSEVRRRAGKPARGTINISATRSEADVSIELGDDGRGFDLKSIHDKAVAMGKISKDSVLSDEEVADLVFLPGLSTAKRITGLSGRGVGMEIVRESIDSLRGKVEIRTVPGSGSTIKMRFPLTVGAMEGMLLRVGQNTLIIPVSQVRECFRPTAKDISTIEGRGTIVTIRGVVIPVLFLGREFGIESDAKSPEEGVLVVVEQGELITAVLVDDTLGSGQVVIRSLDGLLANLPLVAGAAILPDRSIGLVIETTRLTDRVSIAASRAFSEAGKRQVDDVERIDTVSIGSNQVGVIDFAVHAPDGFGGESPREYIFAINAFKTKEFVQAAPLLSIPGSPPGFAGVMLLRGRTVPIIHMGVVLGLIDESERRPEWEQIVLFCEFAGRTVGFLVTRVNRVSYISWSDIMPPPASGGTMQLDYIVGTILMSKLNGSLSGHGAEEESRKRLLGDQGHVAFVLDFERIVGNVIQLYGDMDTQLGEMDLRKKGGCRVLLVEDSSLIRKKTSQALSKAGITVLEAVDGQDAWEQMEKFQEQAKVKGDSIFSYVDLVLSDIEMPRMDGYTFTLRLKKDQNLRVLPVLLHSSITNNNMVRRATEVEADGFIPKCDPNELATQLRKYL
ncbi:MAG: chemotaxis protein CheW [Planctomycetota bacterium]|jgi:two-component system chemotaxis sensor kinase CheA|nr:chemotaxis protein CheW [Planctomycetota bacterium]